MTQPLQQGSSQQKGVLSFRVIYAIPEKSPAMSLFAQHADKG